MNQLDIAKPTLEQVVWAQSNARSALSGHGALPLWTNQHRDGPSRLGGPHRADLDSARLEIGHEPPTAVIVTDPGH